MTEKEVKKWNTTFKVLHWIFCFCTAFAFWAIVDVIRGIEVTATQLICANLTIIIESLILAFIFMKAKVAED